MAEGLEALLRSAQAALSAASATLPSAEERRAEAAAAESLAVSGAGAVAKTAVGVAGRLRRQWLRWLTEHGDRKEGGETKFDFNETVKKFNFFCFAIKMFFLFD